MPKVDKKMQWVSRLFLAAFAWSLYQLVFVGEFSYHSMGYEQVVTAKSNPFKFYFAMVWSGLMVCVTTYFGFFAKQR